MRVIHFRSRQQLSETQYHLVFPDYLLIYDTSLIMRAAISHDRNNKQTHACRIIHATAGLSLVYTLRHVRQNLIIHYWLYWLFTDSLPWVSVYILHYLRVDWSIIERAPIWVCIVLSILCCDVMQFSQHTVVFSVLVILAETFNLIFHTQPVKQALIISTKMLKVIPLLDKHLSHVMSYFFRFTAFHNTNHFKQLHR